MCDEKVRKTIGIVESVKIKGQRGVKAVEAKIDTGADRTSIDMKLASEIGLGPITDTVKVKSALKENSETRLVVEAEIIIYEKSFKLQASVDDRSRMKYDVLIGRDLLEKSDFLIDPSKASK